jgi:autotransporter-associated beta strand protein
LVNNATAGSISIANNLGGAGAQLQQLGAGTLTLTGTNTYTGVTTIAAGTLALTGTGGIAASSQVNLTNAGATFNIAGTTAGASIVSLNGVSGSNVQQPRSLGHERRLLDQVAGWNQHQRPVVPEQQHPDPDRGTRYLRGLHHRQGRTYADIRNGNANRRHRLQRDHDQRRHPCRQHLARIVQRGHGKSRR